MIFFTVVYMTPFEIKMLTPLLIVETLVHKHQTEFINGNMLFIHAWCIDVEEIVWPKGV